MGSIKSIGYQEAGYTLVELVVVLILVGAASAVFVNRLYKSGRDVRGAERVLEDAESVLLARRAEARRLNGEERGRLTYVVADPVEIDFSDLSTTRELVIEGDDADNNCDDDVSGKLLTCLRPVSGRGVWTYQYRGNAVSLPDGWRVALTSEDLGSIPLIGGGGGKGAVVTKFGFNGRGNAMAFSGGVWTEFPAGAYSGSSPSYDNSSFWAVYFINGHSAVAIAVFPGGVIEKFHYDGSAWSGYKGRAVSGP